MKPTTLSVHVSHFLSHYLADQRNLSPNTIKAYRDVFVLLLRFCRDVKGIPVERLELEQIDAPLIDAFLDHLQQERHCSIRTLNQRRSELGFEQSNAEHLLLERIHQAREQGFEFIIFNPAAFTHTSVALRDALLAVAIPFIEVHLSNVHAREGFRQHSFLSDIAVGVISGLGRDSYTLALQAAINRCKNPTNL